jgi:hypothetical protein
MISADEFRALVATYEKHGWQLRRVVLQDTSKAPAAAETTQGIVDAAWFSRPPKPGPNAWEIRYLGATQLAFVEHLDENSPDFEDELYRIEQRLADAVAAKRTA